MLAVTDRIFDFLCQDVFETMHLAAVPQVSYAQNPNMHKGAKARSVLLAARDICISITLQSSGCVSPALSIKK